MARTAGCSTETTASASPGWSASSWTLRARQYDAHRNAGQAHARASDVWLRAGLKVRLDRHRGARAIALQLSNIASRKAPSEFSLPEVIRHTLHVVLLQHKATPDLRRPPL